MRTLQGKQIMANSETNFTLLVGKAVTSYAIQARKIIFSYSSNTHWKASACAAASTKSPTIRRVSFEMTRETWRRAVRYTGTHA
jgi:hypothetical protein